MSSLPEKLVVLHRTLAQRSVPHAFGGALALAWCTRQARGTIDIDLNVFVPVDRATTVLAALPSQVAAQPGDITLLERDGQARLWWDETPIDVFLSTTPFHDAVALRVAWEPFADTELPFLCCRDIAVFKAFFGRTKDWADLEAMAERGSLDRAAVLGVLIEYLGVDDERVERFSRLPDAPPSEPRQS